MFSLLFLSFLNFFPAHRRYKAFPPQLILMTIQSFHQTERRFIQGYQGKFQIMNTLAYHQILHTTLLDWFKILLSSVTSTPVTQLPAYTNVFCLASQHKYNLSLLLEDDYSWNCICIMSIIYKPLANFLRRNGLWDSDDRNHELIRVPNYVLKDNS